MRYQPRTRAYALLKKRMEPPFMCSVCGRYAVEPSRGYWMLPCACAHRGERRRETAVTAGYPIRNGMAQAYVPNWP